MTDAIENTDASSDNSPLIAAFAGSMVFLVPFLNAGGPVCYTNDDGDTLLHAAADGWQHRMVEFLIISGADPNAQNLKGETPLYMLTTRCDPPSEGTFSSEPDPSAARLKTFHALLWRRADPGIKTVAGDTPLHFAAWHGDLVALKELARPKTIEEKTTKGATALMLAVLNGHALCAKRLMELGANSDVEFSEGDRILDMIRDSDDPDMRALAEAR